MSFFTPEQMTDKITNITLPEIILDLILASTNKLNKLKIPIINLSGNHGFDGEVGIPEDCTDSMPIPCGKLVIEMSVNQNIKIKANRDYNNRKSQTSNDTIFVFITSQIFNKAGKWIEEKKQESDFRWKDLLCITQSELHNWFLRCPSVSIKWCEIWELPTNELYTIGSVWKRWDAAFEYQIPYHLVCALGYQHEGSTSNEKLLVDFINGTGNKFIITASSVEEARLYIATVLVAEKEQQMNQLAEETSNNGRAYKTESLIDKVICLDNKEAFQKLPLSQYEGRVIVTPLQDADVINVAIKNNIKVIQILRATNTREDVNIALPIRVRKEYFHSVLESNKFSYEKIIELDRNSGRNLSTLRSVLANEPQDWVKDISQELLAALLVGGWSSEYEDDQKVLCKLSKSSTYADFTTKLQKYLNKENSPIQHEAPYFRSLSSFSAFPALINNITHEFLKEYQDICITILAKKDNIKALPESEQLLALIKGEKNNFSSLLRKSMADSLIHLSMLYKDNTLVADAVVSQVCSNSIERWKSISPYIIELAEASPKVFLDKFMELIETESIENLQLLVNTNNVERGGCGAYTSILFALELLAWDENYLEQVAKILFKLIPIWDNIPKNVINSPLITLSEIFCIWYPQTNATLEKRNAILGRIAEKKLPKSSELLIKLLPQHNAIATSNIKAKWRWMDSSRYNRDVLLSEYVEALDYIFNLSINFISSDIDLIIKLINASLWNYLSNEQHDMLLEKIRAIQLSKEDSFVLWDTLRIIIARRKKYDDKKTNLDRLKQIESIYNKYTPTDLYDKYIHYFYDYEHCLEITDNLYCCIEMDLRIVDKQKEAVKAIYDEENLDGLLKLIVKLSQTNIPPNLVFFAKVIAIIIEPVLKLGEQEIYNFILNVVSLNVKDNYKLEIVKCYTNTLQADSFITTYDFVKKMGDEFFKIYLLTLPVNDEVLKKIENEDELTQKNYWGKIDIRKLEKISSQNNVIEKLLKYKNYSVAAYLVAYRYKTIKDFDLISKILQGMLECDFIEPQRGAVEILFVQIESCNEDEDKKLLQLEWSYYTLLKSESHRLYKKMVHNAEYFLYFITLCFKSIKNENINTNREVAAQAYDLITASSLNNGPLLQAFRNKNGILDFEQLDNWFSLLKESSKEQGYEEIALSIAGGHLAYSGNVGEDEIFPELLIQKLLNKEEYDELRNVGEDEIFPELPIQKLLNKEEYDELRNGYKTAFIKRHGGIFYGSGVSHYQNLKYKLEKNLQKIDSKYDILCDMFNELIIEIDNLILWFKKNEQHDDMGV